MANTNFVSLDYPFPREIYHENSILYTIKECSDYTTEKTIKSPVDFTLEEIDIINASLTNYVFDANDKLKEKITIFDRFYNAPGLSSLIADNPVLHALCIGHLPTVKHIYNVNIKLFIMNNRKPIKKHRLYDTAIKHGHFKILKWLQNAIPDISCCINAMNIAASGTTSIYADILKWLFSLNINYGKQINVVLNNAACKNHINIIKWALDTHQNARTKNYINNILINAAKYGHLDVFKYIYSEFSNPYYNHAFIQAANYKYINIMDFIISKSTVSQNDTYQVANLAARSGNINIIIWLYEHKFDINRYSIVDYALTYSNIEIVEYIRGRYDNVVISHDSITKVAENNDYLTLVYIRDIFPNVVPNISYNMIMRSNINIIKFVIKEFKAKCNYQTLLAAARCNKYEIFKYISDSFPNIAMTDKIFHEAAHNGNLDMLKYIKNKNPEIKGLSYTLVSILKKNNQEVIKWLIANGCAY